MILGQKCYIRERYKYLRCITAFIFLVGREAFLTDLTLQGKKDSNDYPDNYCFASAVGGGADEEIVQEFSTCLVRNNNDISLRLSLGSFNGFVCIIFADFPRNRSFFQRIQKYHLFVLCY